MKRMVILALVCAVPVLSCNSQPAQPTAAPAGEPAMSTETVSSPTVPGDSPAVAVLVEPGLPVYGGMPGLLPGAAPEILGEHGIATRVVTADELAGGGVDPATTPVLVLLYGNAFPLPALGALQAYQAGGGTLVLNGIPFCHPCDRRDGKWEDLGAINHFGHDPEGLGTGGFAGPAQGTGRFAQHGFQPNPLGLQDDSLLPSGPVSPQWLDTATLDPSDEVIPLVELLPDDGGDPRPVAALIRHRCEQFNGATNIWLGQTASMLDAGQVFLARQLVVRGVGYGLHEAGRMSAGDLKALYAELDAASRPEPLPSDLAYNPRPRPWGETYLPKSPPMADTISVVDARGLGEAERTALACLQGLTARTAPSIWLVLSDQEAFWLDWHVEKGHIKATEQVEDWRTLFTTHRDAFKGAVVADPDLYRSGLLAANAAACDDLILATPELAEELGIPVTLDLRGRFTTYAEGMRWVWDTYRDELNLSLCDFMHPARLSNGALAYTLQWKGILFWIVGPVDAVEPGSDMFAETQLVAEIFAAMNPNSPVLGFPYHGEGVGPGEVNGVALASKYGRPLVCTDHLPNTSVMSAVPHLPFEQETAPPPPLEQDKIYIAMGLSDGDNQNCWMKFMRNYFDDPRFGEFPFSFGMGPPIADLMPGVAQWYFEKAGPGTEFFADVSGIGYMQPENYGLAFNDPAAVLDGFLGWTATYLDILGMKTLRTVGGEDDLVGRYARGIPGIESIQADMGCYSGRSGIDNLTYMLDDVPVFRAATSWRFGREGYLREVREHVGDKRPAFVNGFVHCWTFPDLKAVCESIVDPADPDMVFVTPSQLASLHAEARAKGWVE
jgi:hypothetical protein